MNQQKIQSSEFLEFAKKMYELKESSNLNNHYDKQNAKSERIMNSDSKTKSFNNDPQLQSENTILKLDSLKDQQNRQQEFLSDQMKNINDVQKRLDGIESNLEVLQTIESKVDNLNLNNRSNPIQNHQIHHKLSEMNEILKSYDMSSIEQLIDLYNKSEETQQVYGQKIDMMNEKIDRLIEYNTNCVQSLFDQINNQSEYRQNSTSSDRQTAPQATRIKYNNMNLNTLKVANNDPNEIGLINQNTIKVVDEYPMSHSQGKEDERDQQDERLIDDAKTSLKPINNNEYNDFMDILYDINEKFKKINERIDSIDMSYKLSHKNECDQIINQKLNLMNENFFKIHKYMKSYNAEGRNYLSKLENKILDSINKLQNINEEHNSNNITFSRENFKEYSSNDTINELKEIIVHSFSEMSDKNQVNKNQLENICENIKNNTFNLDLFEKYSNETINKLKEIIVHSFSELSDNNQVNQKQLENICENIKNKTFRQDNIEQKSIDSINELKDILLNSISELSNKTQTNHISIDNLSENLIKNNNLVLNNQNEIQLTIDKLSKNYQSVIKDTKLLSDIEPKLDTQKIKDTLINLDNKNSDMSNLIHNLNVKFNKNKDTISEVYNKVSLSFEILKEANLVKIQEQIEIIHQLMIKIHLGNNIEYNDKHIDKEQNFSNQKSVNKYNTLDLQSKVNNSMIGNSPYVNYSRIEIENEKSESPVMISGQTNPSNEKYSIIGNNKIENSQNEQITDIKSDLTYEKFYECKSMSEEKNYPFENTDSKYQNKNNYSNNKQNEYSNFKINNNKDYNIQQIINDLDSI